MLSRALEQKLARQAKNIEREPRPLLDALPATAVSASPVVRVLKITGALSGGLYPARVQTFSGSSPSDIAGSDDAKVLCLNGQTFSSGDKVPCLCVETDSGSGFGLWVPAGGNFGSIPSGAYNGATVNLSGTQTITTGVSGAALLFGTEVVDTNSYHSVISNTERLTAPATGYYQGGAKVQWEANTTGYRSAGILLNVAGGYFDDGPEYVNANETPDLSDFTWHRLRINPTPLSAGDYVSVIVSQTSGGNLLVTAASLWLEYLGS